MPNKIFRKARKGVTLIISFFIAAVALIMTVLVLNLSNYNTQQIVDDNDGKIAYYAAEAGINYVQNLFNSDSSKWGLQAAALSMNWA